MGIGKGKSDKIDIDGLIEGVGNENKVAQEESKLEQKIKELKDVRLELEAATRKMEEVTFALKTATDSADNIISGICRAIVKAEQNIVFRAKISTDELAKVHQCTVRHIKAEEDLLERHSDKMAKHLQNNEGVIVKTCSDICFTIGQKNCQMFVAKLHKFHHPHNRMRFYPAHSVLSFPDFAVDTFLPQRFLR